MSEADMKFSMDVTIDSQLYLPSSEKEERSSTPTLSWNISVTDVKVVRSQRREEEEASQFPRERKTTRAKVGGEEGAQERRVSRMEQEEMAIKRAMRKTSRKVHCYIFL